MQCLPGTRGHYSLFGPRAFVRTRANGYLRLHGVLTASTSTFDIDDAPAFAVPARHTRSHLSSLIPCALVRAGANASSRCRGMPGFVNH